ncbi:ABC transporter substrate-binding protein [Shewanella litorisediminis]|uniref:Extracellular solute-binding protein n=1 Tax=Shewanella litorisediminis TaxID=1173586 RepID=A0ABX7G297_9GAMM|nr:extracellular solute-binding protein [Shewanella litorisediminis]MCL2918631.1 extracellular solute-binding protein [Shewanella litorisediminis]QRH01455.1 extracellular solute-binding protein [Shewanella litorisediminis]
MTQKSLLVLLLMLLVGWPLNGQAKENCLVILTSFSELPFKGLVDKFSAREQCDVRVIYRRTLPAIRLLTDENQPRIDLVVSSSPTLFQTLHEQNLLAPLGELPAAPAWLKRHSLPAADYVLPVAYSGIGLMFNRDYLNKHGLPQPKSWQDLAEPGFNGHVMMSSPSHSGTTHMMVENILQSEGWDEGWALLMRIGGNLASLSARSFGVSDAISRGLVGAGPVIDNYASVARSHFDYLGFTYLPDTVILPTYCGLTTKAEHATKARQFLSFLLSAEGQTILTEPEFAKIPLSDDKLANSTAFVIEKQQLFLRNNVIKAVFEQAIAQQLPKLRYTWLAIIKAQGAMKDSPKNHDILRQAMTLASRVPISEAEAMSPDLQAVFADYEQQPSAQMERTMQDWRMQVAQQLEQAMALVRTLEYP